MTLRKAWAGIWMTILSADVAAAAMKPRGEVHVLFIGNSMTYYNHMPDTFRRMVEATAPGLRIDVQSVAPDAVMLEDHWRSAWTQSRLRERHWDYVVLQEQGGLSHWNQDGVVHNAWPRSFESHVGKFAEVVQAGGGKVVMYQSTPASAKRLDYMAWAYTKAAIDHEAILAPVGRVVYRLPEDARKRMILPDDGHPTPAGSCIAAATLAGAMFGKPAATLVAACPQDVDPAAVRAAAPLIDGALADIGKPGAYHPLPQPAFEPEPQATPGDAVDAAQLKGSWFTRAPGVPLSWGVHLDFPAGGKALSVRVINYGGNTAFDMPIDAVEAKAGVLTVRTHGDNRHYRFELARNGDTLSGYAVSEVNGGAEYQRVTFTRAARPDDYFAHLDALQARTDATYRAQGLDAALLERYDALTAWRGEAEVDKITMGGLLSDPWLSMLTAQDYADKGDDRRALEYYTFAAKHFPGKADPHGGLGEHLEHMGRLREALPELVKATEIDRAARGNGFDSEWEWYIGDIKRRLGEPDAASTSSKTP